MTTGSPRWTARNAVTTSGGRSPSQIWRLRVVRWFVQRLDDVRVLAFKVLEVCLVVAIWAVVVGAWASFVIEAEMELANLAIG